MKPFLPCLLAPHLDRMIITVWVYHVRRPQWHRLELFYCMSGWFLCVLNLCIMSTTSTSSWSMLSCADDVPQQRNISYIDLDRFSSHQRVSHMDLGPVSPPRKPLQLADGKARYWHTCF